MTEREKLLSFLFDRDDGRELINLKFFLDAKGRNEAGACAAAHRVLERLWSDNLVESVMPSETAILHSDTKSV